MRIWGAVALVSLVVLAGCGAIGQSAETPTVSPAPVPSAPTPTTEVAPSAALPPGVTEAGIVNLSALVRGHRSALVGRSYRLVHVTNRTTGTSVTTRRRVVRVHNRTVYHARRVDSVDGNRTEQVAYADGRQRYARCETAGRCPAGSVEDTETYALGTVLGLLSGTESTVAETVRRDGRVSHRIVASGNPVSIGSAYGVVDIRNYSATALVAPSGLVSEARASYVVVRGERRIRVTVRLRYTDVGETRVTPPPWYRQNTTRADGVRRRRAGRPAPSGGA